VASALMTTMQQVGTALGLAVLVGLATWTTRASDLAVADATASGLQTATMVGAGVLVVAAVCTAVVMPRRAR
jgi:2-methylcitrate dehydratase PrpD